MQHDKRAKQSDLHGLALEQIKMQLEELKNSNIDMDTMLSNRLETIEHVFHDMSSNAQQNLKNDEAQDKKELGTYMLLSYHATITELYQETRIAEIKQWINAPEYMREYERAHRIRLPETGDYLLESSLYRKWKEKNVKNIDSDSSLGLPSLPQMLVIKGLDTTETCCFQRD